MPWTEATRHDLGACRRRPSSCAAAALAALPRQPGRLAPAAWPPSFPSIPHHGHHKLQTTPGHLIAGNGFPKAGSGHSQPPRRRRTSTDPATPEQAPMGCGSSMPCRGCSSGLLWFRSVQQMHHIRVPKAIGVCGFVRLRWLVFFTDLFFFQAGSQTR